MSRYVVHLASGEHPIVAEDVDFHSSGWIEVRQKLGDPKPGRPAILIPPHRIEDVEDHGKQVKRENSG